MTRVLVLEDEASSQEIVRRALNRMGIMDVECAADGAMGLRILDRMERKPDLIILDIFMPEKDGIEIVHALAQRKFSGGLVLISGGDSQFPHIAVTMATRTGLHLLGTLQKPFSDEALADALKLVSN